MCSVSWCKDGCLPGASPHDRTPRPPATTFTPPPLFASFERSLAVIVCRQLAGFPDLLLSVGSVPTIVCHPHGHYLFSVWALCDAMTWPTMNLGLVGASGIGLGISMATLVVGDRSLKNKTSALSGRSLAKAVCSSGSEPVPGIQAIGG